MTVPRTPAFRRAVVADLLPFADLLQRVRSGDERAAEQLVRQYESAIRVAVRTRLTDPALRRQFDSMDVCQSVLRSFFVRAAAGQYDLSEPAQLVGLLTRMAQNKLAMQARAAHRRRRDTRRAGSLEGRALDTPDTESGPDRQAAGRDLLAALYARLGAEERDLAERRAAGQTWPEIALAVGGTAQARRKQLARAIDHLAPELGLDPEDDADE